MTISNTSQTVSVDGVTAVVVTPITQDSNSGLFMRSVQFFDVVVQGSNQAVPRFTIIFSGATQQAVELSTPSFSF